MRILILTALIFLHSTINAQSTLKQYFEEAMSARSVGNNIGYLTAILKADSIRPNHQLIQYYVGTAYARLGDSTSAIQYLEKSVVSKGDIDLLTTDFNLIRETAAFHNLLDLQEEIMKEVSTSEPAFSLSNPEFHAEGLAFDPISQRFFVGSVHTREIWKYDENSNQFEVFSDANDGLWSVFGMCVDSARNTLWVATTATKFMNGFDSTLIGKAALLKYNLVDNSIKKYELKDDINHWFGDLTVDSKGKVYVSDGETNTIYTVNSSDQLEIFHKNEEVRSLQGLAVSYDDQYLFYSGYSSGIYRLDLKTKKNVKIDSDLEISTKSIDGLYYFDNSLIITQNLVVPMRVSQLFLSKDQLRVEAVRYLEKGNPVLNEPTLGVIKAGWFYYIANSQWGAYNADGTLNLDLLDGNLILRTNISGHR